VFGLFALFVIGGVVFFGAMVWLTVPRDRRGTDELTERDASADRAAIKKTFSDLQKKDAKIRRLLAAGDDDLKAIQLTLTKWALAGDEDSMAPLVDRSRFAKAVASAPSAIKFNWQRLQDVESRFFSFVPLPGPKNECRIVDLRYSAGRDEALAYCYLLEGESHAKPMRCWLIRRGDRFQIYDWEHLGQRRRESEHCARQLRVEQRGAWASLYDAWQDERAAKIALDAGQTAQAVEHLQRKEGRVIPSEFADWEKLDLASYWILANEPQRCLDTLAKIATPEDYSTVFTLRANALDRLGRYEEALAELRRQERLFGGGPAAESHYARLLSALHRHEEAKAHYREYLAYCPESPQELAELAALLDDAEKPELKENLARFKRPAEAALALVDAAVPRDDCLAIDAAIALLQKDYRQSPELACAEGWRQYIDGDHAAAAAKFKSALDREPRPDKKRRYLHEYLDSMVRAERALEAYEAAPDPASAFEYLTDGYYDDEMMVESQALERLVEAHLRREPDDPRANYLHGTLLLERKDYAKARAAFEKCLAQPSDDDLASSCRDKLYEAMHAQGETLAAYDRSEGEAFLQLAWKLKAEKNGDLLEKILQRHSAQHPEEPWLNYYRAAAHRLRGQSDQAAELLTTGYHEAEQNHFQASYHYELLDLLFETAGPVEALRRAPEKAKSFDQIAPRLSGAERWADLEALVAAVEANDADLAEAKAQALVWRVQLLTLRGDYGAIVERLTPWPADLYAALPVYSQRILRARLLRAYLRTGRLDEGLAWAEAMAEKENDRTPKFALLIESGKAGDALSFLDEYEKRGHNGAWLSNDPDLAATLAHESFAEIRRRCSPDWPEFEYDQELVLLLRKAVEDPEQVIRQAVHAALGPNAQYAQTSDLVGGGYSATLYHVQSSDWNGSIAFWKEPLGPKKGEKWPDLENPALAQALTDHRATIVLNWAGKSHDLGFDYYAYQAQLGAPAEDAFARKIAREIGADENCLAYYWDRNGQLALNNSATRDAMIAADAGRQMADLAEEHPMLFWTGSVHKPPAPEAVRRSRALKRELRSIAERNKGDAFEGLELQAQANRGVAVEPLWLRALDARREDDGGRSYLCELQSDSRIRADLKAGMLFRVSESQVRDYRKSPPSP
jgi:hypothetical protein